MRIINALFLSLLLMVFAIFSGCRSAQKAQPAPEVSKENIKVVTETSPAIVGGMEMLYNHLTYPPEAQNEGVEIKLNASVLIDKNGKISKLSFDKKTKYGFREAAEAALRSVQFVPGKRNGEPVDMFITVPITFSL